MAIAEEAPVIVSFNKKVSKPVLISIGLIGIYSDYKLSEKKDAQVIMAEIEEELARQAALEAFQKKLAEEKAAAAASTAA